MGFNIFVLTFLFLSSYAVCSATTTSANINPTIQSQSVSRMVNESIREYLKKIEKSSLKTIKSPDGDLIDCVPFDQQPAFDHPLLQGQLNKTIPDLPELPKGYLPNNDTTTFDPETFQVWRMSGESCPENTVPIRRTTEEDIQRAQTLKPKKALPEGYNQHEHAIGYTKGKFYGGEAVMNVWLPHIENKNEVSFTQMWVMAGRIDEGTLNSIEAGYRVVKGDTLPRFFVFYTNDAYRGGCFNTECSGYCQVNRKISPGLTINPVSHYNSNQQEITCTVWKAPEDGNWWVAVNGVQTGYWPSALFPLLQYSADTLEIGGEVLNSGNYGQHTTTQMGSGHFPGEGYKRAAFIKHLAVVNNKNKKVSPGRLGTVIDKPNCYGLQAFTNDANWGDYMYRGELGVAALDKY